jgi:hypothetical protein
MKQDKEERHIKVSIPKECHLWNKKGITGEEVTTSLVLVKMYEDDSHLIRSLMQCKECGHLFFHEFYEVVDWEHGNDAQYSTWIPVDDGAGANNLNDLSPLELLRYGGLRIDFPSNAEKPSAPRWNMPEYKE